jgi:hypothetical protein
VSLLLSAVAVRHRSADDVVDVVRAVARDAGVAVEVLPTAANPGEDLGNDWCVSAEAGGWVTVHPHYVVPPDGLAVALTSRLSTVSSATAVYETVLWTHDLVAHGRVLDRYVNLPSYFGPGEYGPEHEGNPELVADTLGVDRTVIAPYFRQVSWRRARSRLLPPPKAHATDTCDLLDGWVITDLWRRVGITWGLDAPGVRLRVGHDENLGLNEHLRVSARS